MSDEVVDLDVLRPPPKKIKLDGKLIDVSYVPWDVDRLVKAIFASQTGGEDEESPAQELSEKTKQAFELTLELCATFCANQHPAMTLDWFRKYTDPAQVNGLSTQIIETLQRSFEGAEAYQGN